MKATDSIHINVLVIEDEPFAQNEITRLLKNSSYTVEIIDYIDSVEDAVEWFETHDAPDLVFLDIQLSDGLSFQIFEQTKVLAPVIFTTAFDEYAIEAFKLNSIDYLLKPIEPKALESALSKYFEIIGHYSSDKAQITETQVLKLLEQSRAKEEYKSRFIVKIGDQIKYIPVEEIAYFFAEDNVVFLVTSSDNRYIIDHSLNQLTNFLNPEQFYRLNRSYYTNIKAIVKIHKFFNSRLKVDLIPEATDEILVSRVKVNEFLSWIES